MESTIEGIYILRWLMKRYKENKRFLCMVFIDLKKAYVCLPKKVMWWTLENKQVYYKNIQKIKDMYNETVTTMRTMEWIMHS